MPGDRADRVRAIVVMGVSGSGKTTIGELLASALGYTYVEGDWLHSPEDREHMHEGIALTDVERLPWLDALGARLAEESATGDGAVTACSALRKRYRDVLRSHVPDAFFVALEGSSSLIRERLEARHHAFMSPALLDSQLEAYEPLEPGESGITVDVLHPPDSIVSTVVTAITVP